MAKEYRAAVATDHLGQGDVLRPVGSRVSEGYAAGIVVTADCDLLWRKHGGSVSFVPVVAVADYLSSGPLARELERIEELARSKACAEFHRLQRVHVGDRFPKPISVERLTEWLETVQLGEVAELLGVDEEAVASLGAAWAASVEARAAVPRDFDEQWRSACSLNALLGRAKSVDKADATLTKEMNENLKKLPGDLMYLNEVDDLSGWGYVVFLRPIQQVDETAIALSSSDDRANSEFRRTASLASTFTYALTQRLASVFSSIGLPAQYEQDRASVISAIKPALLKENT